MSNRARTPYALLAMLSLGPRSGYDIQRGFRASIGHFWSESNGQIYPGLKGLVAAGLAEVFYWTPIETCYYSYWDAIEVDAFSRSRAPLPKAALPRGRRTRHPSASRSTLRWTSMADAQNDSLRGSETVLVVEDYADLRGMIREFLEFHGYRVLDACDGEEAKSLAKRYIGPIHLLLTDMDIPEPIGWQLSEQIRELRPEIKVLYMSANEREALVSKGRLGFGAPFLEKPFTRRILAVAVRGVLSGGDKRESQR